MLQMPFRYIRHPSGNPRTQKHVALSLKYNNHPRARKIKTYEAQSEVQKTLPCCSFLTQVKVGVEKTNWSYLYTSTTDIDMHLNEHICCMYNIGGMNECGEVQIE